MKKVICSLLILLMLLSMLPMTVSAETPVEPNYVVTSSQYFTDVDSGKAYYTAANYLYEQGIMAGVSTPYASGKVAFGGERALTRAELVITLWRLDGSHEVTFYGQFPFSDCSYDQTVLSAVKWAVKNNIVGGTDETHFSPTQEVTHQDALLILYRFIDYCGYELKSEEYYRNYYGSPMKGFSGYAKFAAGWAYLNSILTKKDIDTIGFGAKEACTRGFLAQYLYRMIRKYQNKYALIVFKSNSNWSGVDCTQMKRVFEHYGVKNVVVKRDITKAEFEPAMNSAFGNAKPLDLCYLHCECHGAEDRKYLCLFIDGDLLLYSNTLKTEINKKKGTFVVFLQGCYTGIYTSITQSTADKHKIKLLCSSKADQKSYGNGVGMYTYAVRGWYGGCGLPSSTATEFGSMVADQYGTVGNKNGRISLRELYQYSYDKVYAATDHSWFDNIQEIVCSNTSDKFNIFYTSLPNG
ncbi:MAG: S-layer homology domain-containing protein [Schwartzia sp.]|nr:S-layer homology domain-containing protein [Schwartzia sp. (in: firmicutes)]